MKAKAARKLKVGDWVRASFGFWEKDAEIIAIAWPKFTIRTIDSRSREMIRTRRYDSLWYQIDPPNFRAENWPAWLRRPKSGDLAEPSGG